MFNNKRRNQRLREQLEAMKPTSKSALKRECLYLCHLDIDKAERMYDFLVKGMEGIPDVEPEAKGFLKNLGEQAGGVLGWLRDNKDMLEEGAGFIRGLLARKGGGPAAPPLPPING